MIATFPQQQVFNALIAAGLPVVTAFGPEPVSPAIGPQLTAYQSSVGTWFGVVWTSGPTVGQDSSASSIIAAQAWTPRVPRTIQAITGDIFNPAMLSTAQKNAIVLNLFGTNSLTITGATNSLVKTDVGDWAKSISALFVSLMNAAGSTVFISQSQQLVVTAWYVADNPNYLVHPAFDNTINIPGDVPS